MDTTTVDKTRELTITELRPLWPGPRTLVIVGFGALLLAFAGSWRTTAGLSHLAHSYLTSLCFYLSISLGGLFFVMLQHLTGARWSVVLRRIAELTTSAMPVLTLLTLPIIVSLLLGSSLLYEWNDAELRNEDPLIAQKSAYLNATFFAARMAAYFAVWALLSRFFLRQSLSQDTSESGNAAGKMRRYSGPAMIAFALTTNFAAFDLLMSLDPHWFSTIYGVYYFSGAAVAICAMLVVIAALLQRAGYLTKEITTEHYHDLGKLLFGFNLFWAYIAFSQYLLIWYANIPEETGWFYVRQSNGWQLVSLLLIFGHFIIPFFGLMSRSAKRDVRVLLFWSVFLLVMHWIDLFWLVMPSLSSESVPFSFLDLLCFFGLGAIWCASILRTAMSVQLIPTGDPHLDESLAFHNV
jgi:hypothetical protein